MGIWGDIGETAVAKPPSKLTLDDATKLLVHLVRSPNHGNYGSYGYDIYLSTALRVYLERSYQLPSWDLDQSIKPLMPELYAAAWELCRRGILRPGISHYGAQATDAGGSGEGYSITPFGKQWLAESDKDDFVPVEPERFGQMLAPFQARFGVAFSERAQEAIRCYGAHAYLASCAMCGAAAEAIMLATAIAKADEETILKEYLGAGGRKKVENRIVGQRRKELVSEFQGYLGLLKYWRDEAAHGGRSGIGDNEAFTSLAMLLRFALFTDTHWSELTTP